MSDCDLAVHPIEPEPAVSFAPEDSDGTRPQGQLEARELSGQRVVPLQVSFRHPPRAGTEEHEAFFGVPIRWSAPENALVLSDTVLAQPVLSATRGLYPQLLLQVDAQQDQAAPPEPTVQEVRAHIELTLQDGTPLKETIARAVGMSARTLFRRLAEAGTTFDAILDRTRRELAIHYTHQPRWLPS